MTTSAERDGGTNAPRIAARSGLAWRLITAAVGIPVVIALAWAGGIIFALFAAAALALGYWEYHRALRLEDTPTAVLLTAITAALPLAALDGESAVLAVLTAGLLAVCLLLVLRGVVPDGLAPWGLSLAGVLYVGLLGQYAVGLRGLDDGRAWLLLAIFTTFATDTGAYAVGSLLGRHKLVPRISPSKTIEGAAGGLLAGALAAWALASLLDLGQPAHAMLALGAAAAIAGQTGDLFESLIKRAASVKDMGARFPGHGGILDRLDSLLFVIPLIYVAATRLLT